MINGKVYSGKLIDKSLKWYWIWIDIDIIDIDIINCIGNTFFFLFILFSQNHFCIIEIIFNKQQQSSQSCLLQSNTQMAIFTKVL